MILPYCVQNLRTIWQLINLSRRYEQTRFEFEMRFGQISYITTVPWFMMTSSNGSIFCVTGPLCGEFTGPGEFPTQRPVTRSFDVFFDLHLNKRLSKQPWGWWFETSSWSLWRQSNVVMHGYQQIGVSAFTDFTGGCCDRVNKLIFNSNLAKSCLSITYVPVEQSSRHFSQSTILSLISQPIWM